ncbi:MarR family winged helix-turn-helix transcriptional regulator [Halalkalibacter okhensis]|uniref:MarR family transcriptional regulator n=1 Tax=Halalkalibacter okhensis TaxID=333138 RepID=A0A0B0IGW1_9BACI|nr:MarR family transcriptional regulator [Halalkalibacter okhensis]KHF40550.1 MarR family transcriptional regulator [Halalkalibacter okhensis]
METSNLLHTLNQKARLSSKQLNEELQEFGLYSSQWAILYVLNQNGTMTQTEIWQYLKVEPPTVTRTLVRMEASGWVIRKSGKDKRERCIVLTEMAKEKFPLVQSRLKRFEDQFVSPLSQQEQQQLQHLLEKLGQKRDDLHEGQ